MTNYWIMKSEPSVYSIDTLKADGFTNWEGVRNFQARNYMRDQMRVGDLAFFYHSNAKPSGVAGICKIVETGIADTTALDPKSDYYDPKAAVQNPIWMMVKVCFVEKFPSIVPIQEIRNYPELENLMLLQKGSRLSITPISKKEFEFIRHLGNSNL